MSDESFAPTRTLQEGLLVPLSRNTWWRYSAHLTTPLYSDFVSKPLNLSCPSDQLIIMSIRTTLINNRDIFNSATSCLTSRLFPSHASQRVSLLSLRCYLSHVNPWHWSPPTPLCLHFGLLLYCALQLLWMVDRGCRTEGHMKLFSGGESATHQQHELHDHKGRVNKIKKNQ